MADCLTSSAATTPICSTELPWSLERARIVQLFVIERESRIKAHRITRDCLRNGRLNETSLLPRRVLDRRVKIGDGSTTRIDRRMNLRGLTPAAFLTAERSGNLRLSSPGQTATRPSPSYVP